MSSNKRILGNGSGSISEVKDKKGKSKYRVRVTVSTSIDPETGRAKQTQKSLGVFKTRKEAQEVLAEYWKSPYDLTSKVHTFADLYEEWSKAYFEKITESARRTVESSYAYCEAIKPVDIRTFSIGVLKEHVKTCWRYDAEGFKKVGTPNTQARVKSLLNLMFDYAVEYNLMQKNLAREFKIGDDTLKAIKKNKKHKKAFSEDNIKDFWSGISAVSFTDMLLIGNYTGFRPQELATIPVNRVHFINADGVEVNPIVEGSAIYEALQEKYEDGIDELVEYLKDKDFICWGMKTEAGDNRVVPILPKIKPFVENYYASATKFFESDLLFNNSKGQQGTKMTYDKFRGMFKTMMNYYRLTGFTPHCIRVTFITRARREFNFDNLALQTIVGHAPDDNSLLESTYTYRTPLDIVSSAFEEIKKMKY